MRNTKDFDTFYVEMYTRVYRYICTVMRTDSSADDLAQETFYAAYQKWDTVKEHENPEGWLYKTAHNIVRNHCKKADNRVLSTEEMELDVPDGNPDNGFSAVDMEVTMDQILTEEEKDILCKHYVDGYSMAEIGESVGTTEGNIKVRMSRIRKKMRGSLE